MQDVITKHVENVAQIKKNPRVCRCKEFEDEFFSIENIFEYVFDIPNFHEVVYAISEAEKVEPKFLNRICNRKIDHEILNFLSLSDVAIVLMKSDHPNLKGFQESINFLSVFMDTQNSGVVLRAPHLAFNYAKRDFFMKRSGIAIRKLSIDPHWCRARREELYAARELAFASKNLDTPIEVFKIITKIDKITHEEKFIKNSPENRLTIRQLNFLQEVYELCVSEKDYLKVAQEMEPQWIEIG